MTHYVNDRRLKVMIYFTSSPMPVTVEGVMNILTEAGLLRIITEDGKSQWWPLCQVFNVREIERVTV